MPKHLSRAGLSGAPGSLQSRPLEQNLSRYSECGLPREEQCTQVRKKRSGQASVPFSSWSDAMCSLEGGSSGEERNEMGGVGEGRHMKGTGDQGG
jgi:hypothetical protein